MADLFKGIQELYKDIFLWMFSDYSSLQQTGCAPWWFYLHISPTVAIRSSWNLVLPVRELQRYSSPNMFQLLQPSPNWLHGLIIVCLSQSYNDILRIFQTYSSLQETGCTPWWFYLHARSTVAIRSSWRLVLPVGELQGYSSPNMFKLLQPSPNWLYHMIIVTCMQVLL